MGKPYLKYELDIAPNSSWITATPSPQVRSGFLYVQELGDFYAGPRYFTERRGLSSYLIKYAVAGEGLLTYRDQTHIIRPGQFFWLDCTLPQYYATSPGSSNFHVLWVHFYGANSAKYYEQLLALNNGSNIGTLPSHHTVADGLRSLLAMYRTGQNSLNEDLRASAILAEILAECACASHSTGATSSATPDVVVQAQHFLSECYDQRITLDQLGEKYALDKYYFLKLFKRHTGLTPNEFLLLTRLTQAKELLRTTQHSVGQISLEVGIPNASHFIKLFQRHEGVTPGGYRQSWYQS